MTLPAKAETGTIVPTLMACEAIIQAGLATFIDVGEALADIQNHKLYRQQGFKTFDEYCRTRWDFDRTYANRLVGAAEVSKVLPMGNKPANERQARALAPLKDEPEKMAAALTDAKERTGGKPTAKDVAASVAARVEPTITVDEDDLEDMRGLLSKSCKAIAALPPPRSFLAAQGTRLKDRHRTAAEDAYAWLGELLKEWNAR